MNPSIFPTSEITSSSILESISHLNLLKHTYYQAWTDGTLDLNSLRLYARQYYHHVKAFPRYISAMHSNCEKIENRQILLENLVEEERGPENHPDLWLRFAEALGLDRKSVENEPLLPETDKLISTFFRNATRSYASGLGVLLAYENQIPGIAEFKIAALRDHYGFRDPNPSTRGLGFFEVHKTADVFHSQAVAGLIDQLGEEDLKIAKISALDAAQALWGFLDGVNKKN